MIFLATLTFNIIHPVRFWPKRDELPQAIELDTVAMLEGKGSISDSPRLASADYQAPQAA